MPGYENDRIPHCQNMKMTESLIARIWKWQTSENCRMFCIWNSVIFISWQNYNSVIFISWQNDNSVIFTSWQIGSVIFKMANMIKLYSFIILSFSYPGKKVCHFHILAKRSVIFIPCHFCHFHLRIFGQKVGSTYIHLTFISCNFIVTLLFCPFLPFWQFFVPFLPFWYFFHALFGTSLGPRLDALLMTTCLV